MDMPKPGPEHKRLEVFAGTWIGRELMHPSPWDPKGGPLRPKRGTPWPWMASR
jgi:hypothetical protein